MKKILLGAAALAALAAPAFAADMPARTYTKAPAYTAPQVVYNWTGFYVGGHVGGAFAGNNALQSSDARFLGGVQGGFDYQFAPNWVGGIEAQYSWMDRNNTGIAFPAGTVITSRNDQLGSVTGRFGYTWGPALVYAKGGYAWRDNPNIGVTAAGVPVAFTTNGSQQSGWTVGAGLEVGLVSNVSVKAEYLYIDLGNFNCGLNCALAPGGNVSFTTSIFRAGANVRF